MPLSNEFKKKKVLIFSLVYLPEFVGGAEVAVHETVKRIPKEEVEFHLVALRNKESKDGEYGNVFIHHVGVSVDGNSFIFKLEKYLFPIMSAFKSISLNRKYKFDTTWALMANYAGFGALFTKLIFPKKRFVLTLQEGDPIPFILHRVRFVLPLFKMIFKKANKIHAISNFLSQFAKDMGAKVVPVVIPNGVDLERFKRPADFNREAVRAELGYDENDFVLVTASRLVKKNAVDVVTLSLKDLPENVKFLILGEGEDKEFLIKLARDSGVLSRIKFLGYTTHEDLPRYLYSADSFIRPSRSEGLGSAFLEAMATGLPVIATEAGGIPDFIKDRETGIFVAIDDPKDTALKIEELMNDKNLLKLISKNGEELAFSKYDWQGIADEIKKLF